VNDYCVIGSGPSAVAAAMALMRRGLRVTMLDAGRTIEPARGAIVDRMRGHSPEQWSAGDLVSIKEGVEPSASGIPLKRLYGSPFPFEEGGAGFVTEAHDAGVRASFAQGGLSNVWGAGTMRWHRDDIADWPIDADDLEPGYRGVLSFVGDLDAMPPSRQGAAFLRDAERSSAALAKAGISVERSHLAVQGKQCVRCGLCLYGCPYELIYNSAYTLRELLTMPGFRYEPGIAVDRLIENNGRVRIVGRDMKTQALRETEAGRVLLGAGVIPSTAIVLGSLGDLDRQFRLQDSFYFLVPLVRFAATPRLERERLHTLAQAFVLMRDRESIHFSVYGYNDLMRPSLRAAGGLAGAALASRMLVCGGYLHSRVSPGLRMTVRAGMEGRGYRILLTGEDSREAKQIARRAAWRLTRQSARLRAVCVAPAIRFPPPGRGFHSGGSFPMRRDRVSHTSDIEGRPFGFDRVHLIDASCLPSIPATTITLPVMANAWRIANLAADRGVA